jgi:hypothetical protein
VSWGVDIEVDHGDGYTTTIEVVDGHTYNLTPMWRKAGVVENSTSELEGQVAGHLAPRLLDALSDAWKRESVYRELDPPNGWGDYDGFIEILTRLARLCHQHPTGTLRWNG